MAAAPGFVDVAAVRRHFARLAADYPAGDFLAREIDARMLERLDYVSLKPARVLDLGCSRGGSLAALQARYPEATRLAVDAVPAMLTGLATPTSRWQRWLGLGQTAAPLWPLAADAAALPLAAASVDLIWSNLLLHWLDDPVPVMAEAHRVLSVGGLFMFSTLGPDSLKELRQAFGDTAAHTQRFVDMHDYGDMLVASGFADPVMDMEVLTLTYNDVDALLADLRRAGSRAVMRDRARGLSGRQAWARMRAAYEGLRREGRLPLTLEVVYGHAWKVAPTKRADGRSVVQFRPRPA